MTTVEIERDRLRDRVSQLAREAERLQGELDRVQSELDQVQDEQSKIEYALTVLERVAGTITEADKGHEPTVQPDRAKPLRHRSRGTYDLAVQTINGSTRTWRVDELVRQMREAGWDVKAKNPIETVRAALSRAVASGEVSRPSYGTYGPRGLAGEVSSSDAGLEHGRDPGVPDLSHTNGNPVRGDDAPAN
jgi:hypothetical protein